MQRQKVPMKKNTDTHSPLPRLRGQDPHRENGAPIMLPRKRKSQEAKQKAGFEKEESQGEEGA